MQLREMYMEKKINKFMKMDEEATKNAKMI